MEERLIQGTGKGDAWMLTQCCDEKNNDLTSTAPLADLNFFERVVELPDSFLRRFGDPETTLHKPKGRLN
jgi:hypothetical protein